MLTHAEKQTILQASLRNIGRLIPEGMYIIFTRDPGCASTMELTYPGGLTTTAIFTNYSPIHQVPEVPYEEWFDESEKQSAMPKPKGGA